MVLSKTKDRKEPPSNMRKWKALIIKSNLGFLRDVHLGKKWLFFYFQCWKIFQSFFLLLFFEQTLLNETYKLLTVMNTTWLKDFFSRVL